MAIQTRYITKDEFKEYSGIDLEAQLKSDGNPSNTANAFLARIELRMEAFLNANFFRSVSVEFQKFSDFQKEHYKYALMEQAIYVLRNGDISTDSGYEQEKGKVAEPLYLKGISIAPNAQDQLAMCGLWCRKISGVSRGGDFYGDWGY